MKKFLSLFLFSLFAFTALAAVSSSPAPDETITILGVPGADDANGSSILVGESSQLAAYLTARVDNVDDFVANVTSEATWSSSSNRVARVIPNGRKVLLSALSGGKTTIRCEYEGISESFDLTVVDVALEDLELSRKSAVLVEKQSESITASLGGYQDVTAAATWTSSNETVAIVEAGVVTGVAEGTATITCEFQGKTATCAIYVLSLSTPTSGLKDGSDYYIFQMDATTFEELDQAGKVTSDMRTNGAFEGEVLIPEDANRIYYTWNIVAEEIADAPQTGLNAFGKAEEWFSIASADYTPEGGWGVICGGLGIGTREYPASSDAEVAKLQNLTPDHVFVVVLKGKYTPAISLQISMTPPAGGDDVTLFEITDSTGEYNDGDWEVFTLTYADLVALGIDLSQPITAETWYPWTYTANGAGNRVDVDCVFFYIPDDGTSINETRSSAAINVTAKNGRIYCDEAFRIVNMAGQDVTSLNGELQGTYLVVAGDETVKVSVD